MTANVYLYDGDGVRRIAAPAERPLRWAAWRPDGAWAMLVGNRGQALRFDGDGFEPLATRTSHNLRGVAWAPDGERALLVGNRGALLLYDGERFDELPAVTSENLRRVAWSPDGSCALIAGNGGVVLRFDASTGAVLAVPGDRAHTMRSIAWRPDGAYALIGAYASRFAGYPRPHMLYRCDGRYTQGILATDEEDDALAIDWRPNALRASATVLIATYGEGEGARNKLIEYTSSGVTTRSLDTQGTLLGLAWRPDGAEMLLCGEGGAIVAAAGGAVRGVDSGTRDNLVGPFWSPSRHAPLAVMLKGPDEKVYTV